MEGAIYYFSFSKKNGKTKIRGKLGTKKRKNSWQKWLVIAIIAVGLIWLGKDLLRNVGVGGGKEIYNNAIATNKLKRAQENYGEEVYRLSAEFDLSYAYLMALLTLECSGVKPAGNRFEKKVFAELLKVKSGERKKYENIKKKHLKDANEEAIRNLATSWGPFQLMGYKCIGMDVQVRDIRGSDATLHGIEWIDEEYGRFIKRERWKDAFHYHNAGRKFPKSGVPATHDPLYVSRGIEYMEYFEINFPD